MFSCLAGNARSDHVTLSVLVYSESRRHRESHLRENLHAIFAEKENFRFSRHPTFASVEGTPRESNPRETWGIVNSGTNEERAMKAFVLIVCSASE